MLQNISNFFINKKKRNSQYSNTRSNSEKSTSDSLNLRISADSDASSKIKDNELYELNKTIDDAESLKSLNVAVTITNDDPALNSKPIFSTQKPCQPVIDFPKENIGRDLKEHSESNAHCTSFNLWVNRQSVEANGKTCVS